MNVNKSMQKNIYSKENLKSLKRSLTRQNATTLVVASFFILPFFQIFTFSLTNQSLLGPAVEVPGVLNGLGPAQHLLLAPQQTFLIHPDDLNKQLNKERKEKLAKDLFYASELCQF